MNKGRWSDTASCKPIKPGYVCQIWSLRQLKWGKCAFAHFRRFETQPIFFDLGYREELPCYDNPLILPFAYFVRILLQYVCQLSIFDIVRNSIFSFANTSRTTPNFKSGLGTFFFPDPNLNVIQSHTLGLFNASTPPQFGLSNLAWSL